MTGFVVQGHIYVLEVDNVNYHSQSVLLPKYDTFLDETEYSTRKSIDFIQEKLFG